MTKIVQLYIMLQNEKLLNDYINYLSNKKGAIH